MFRGLHTGSVHPSLVTPRILWLYQVEFLSSMKNINLATTLFAISLLSGCIDESEQEQEAKDKIADANYSPVSSCNWEDMDKQGLNVLSSIDEADVCNTMQTFLNRSPSVALVRHLSKVIFIMEASGSKDSPKDIAYQIMNIVEARGQDKDDKKIENTFETVTKIFNSTLGHVTPKDIYISLISSGQMAHTLSDDGLISMASLIWEDKKAHGE